MEHEKREHVWDSINARNYLPFELYIESLGGEGGYGCPFLNYLNASDVASKTNAVSEIRALFRSNSVFFSKNKGSVTQYIHFFPDDNILKDWESFTIAERIKR